MGDLNARVGKCGVRDVSVVGPYGEEAENRNGKLWIEFVKREGLMFFNGRKPVRDNTHALTRALGAKAEGTCWTTSLVPKWCGKGGT